MDVDWRRCTGLTPATGCNARPGPSELSLRIVGTDAPQDDTLGAAFVDPRAGGVLATVYFTRIAWLARVTGRDAGMLLGRAAAHELGHLLMRTTSHPGCGLMRATWTQREVRRNHAADWTFTAGDVAAMHQLQATH